MKKTIILILLTTFYLNSFAQDTLISYLDNNFNKTEKRNAVVLRIVTIHKNRYCVTDQFINGPLINYGEYKSVNPWIEDGLSNHYDNYGKLYATGNYVNGRISGKWIYYKNRNVYNVDYSPVKNYFKFLMDSCEKRIIKNITAPLNDTLKIKKNLIKFIQENLLLPARTRNEKPNDTIYVKIIIDTDGTIKCPKAVNLVNADFTYEAFRVLLLYKSDIEIKEPFKLTIPVVFNAKEITTDKETIYLVIEENATFQNGDINTFREWVNTQITYPAIARKLGIEGKVIVQFVVNTEGDVERVKILRSLEPSCDAEVVKVLNHSPKWTPGRQGGKIVKQQFVVPVVFNSNTPPQPSVSNHKNTNDSTFVVVEENASFLGGDINTFRNWIMRGMKYPEDAREKNIQGKVIVQFVINTEGNVVGLKLLDSLNPSCDAEVIKVIRSSPKWVPGKMGGKVVNQMFVIPVVFSLSHAN